ncbi:MAG: phenylalanine--tRNA ligase subunit beta [Gemmatimonadales bacterium]|nr:phenylalanine--tRNA ligase subunit beta [Gemmatimonadales bacterium]
MLVSRRWLEDFLRQPLVLDDLSERLTMLGAAVEGAEPLHAELSELVVGEVAEVTPHPNADRLHLCLVDDGGPEHQSVVCGAPNVRAGAKYPFAPVGAVLPGGLTIAKRKIRGEVSHGMLCSARELGLGEDHEGILELETDRPAGTALLDVLLVGDDRIEIEVNPNRPDLLGHKGVARELAASYQTPFRLPAIPDSSGPPSATPRREGAAATVDGVRVGIEHPEGCSRFLAAVVRGVTVAPSPAWLAQRIEAIGMRPINNIVDATNYVMVEFGQPMHPYDLEKLRGPSVRARAAAPRETLVTLDGKERRLEPEMTVIADDGGAIGVAGVMGGGDSEVSDQTTDLFLECAWFNPSRIRHTRKALEMSSEASYRFERGVDLWGAPDAFRRCLEIILATAGGTLSEEPVDLWPAPSHPPRIFLRPARVAQVLGVELSWREIEAHLVAIGATVVAKPDDGRLAVDVPGWRPDLISEIDLVEEVARLHGYDAFPGELRPFRVGTVPDAPAEIVCDHLRDGLAAAGLFEVVSFPMDGGGEEGSVGVLNPISQEEGYLRRRLLPGLLRQVERNWSVGASEVRLFEIGTVFAMAARGNTPAEALHVAGVLTGAHEPRHWSGDPGQADVWDLKGLFERAVALAHPSATVQVDGAAWVACTEGGNVVGRAMRLFGDAPPWAAPVFGFEIEVDPTPRPDPRFASLPATPASTRDLSLVVPADLTVERVRQVVERAGAPLLEAVEVLSEYRGPDLPEGTRGVAFHFSFRSPERTLRDSEVDEAAERIRVALKTELGIVRRGADDE